MIIRLRLDKLHCATNHYAPEPTSKGWAVMRRVSKRVWWTSGRKLVFLASHLSAEYVNPCLRTNMSMRARMQSPGLLSKGEHLNMTGCIFTITELCRLIFDFQPRGTLDIYIYQKSNTATFIVYLCLCYKWYLWKGFLLTWTQWCIEPIQMDLW